MSRKSARVAIQSYLQAANIPGLGAIFRTQTFETGAADAMPNGGSYGATSYVWLLTDTETQLSMGGAPAIQPNGWREVRYQALLIFDWYVVKSPTTSDDWADALDDMIEAVKAALRVDPTLGTKGIGGNDEIFASALFTPGDEAAISVATEPPVDASGDDENQTWLIHGVVSWPVIENIAPGSNT